MQRFEDANLVAFLNEIAGDRQARRPAAHDSDFLPRRRYRRKNMGSYALLVIGDKAFQVADAERLHFFRQQALAFAMILLWANAPGDGGQNVIFAYLGRGPQKVSRDNQFNKFFNFHSYRAVFDAGWLGALQTSLRLAHGQFGIVAEIDLLEIKRAHPRFLLWHGLAGNLDTLFDGHGVQRLLRHGAHRCSPRTWDKTPPQAWSSSEWFPSLLAFWNSAIDRCSASRYIALRCTSTSKLTWCASNSGPSTQANSLLPSIITRQPPHIPVPSIMMGLRLTTV